MNINNFIKEVDQLKKELELYLNQLEVHIINDDIEDDYLVLLPNR